MKIFLDTSNIDFIKHWLPVIDGVTTNPAILEREGGNLIDLSNLINPKPISIEVCGDMEKEVKSWSKINNAVIKIPLINPDGKDNLLLIYKLASEGIKINCTALFNVSQCLLSERAGAKYVSLFAGRIDDEGGNFPQVIRECKQYLKSAELIVGSIRTVGMVLDSFNAGADIVTIPTNILEKMVTHQNSIRTVREFEDAHTRLSKST